ncbi:shikimate kinase [Fructobacillus fructosus]|uniref:Shikimate kinase n=1 Tax=Fructobacillus fructosus TaxID=1631 RepID=A0ABN9YTV9_9LACO|nr:shikimate kinase [Fructobacillus fructosus]MBC9118991.1 shikimate kinase [Fructobacillus fructosus]MBD9365781.1 shikimate kinase [Leuconostoc mesenteroides]MCK8638568.1 shikimate kinase [Fructobacillus fructosus]CAK1238807.1 Shikimate kinase (AroK) [Fructobacillus fructosus]
MQNPILIGFMGSGKTTVGRALSKALNQPFKDLDQVIEATLKQSIPSYFEANGEAAFRQVEKELLAQHLSTENVLATGGGTACQIANQELLLKSQRPVVWLKASDATTIHNLSGEDWQKRPILADKSAQDVTNLKASREHFYRKTADVIIQVDQKTPEAIAEEIIQRIS